MSVIADQFVGANRLPVLASSINQHLAAAEMATRRGLEHAIAAGQLLCEAKELVGHGEWLAWLQANCQIGPRQAQTCMRLARNRHRLGAIKNAATAHLTITAAEALIGRPRPEPQRGLPGQLDMLGGPEVTAPSPTARPNYDRLVEHITGLEFASAVIREEERRARSDKRRSRFRAIASPIDAALACLREQWRARRQRD
jgi:Protein of unknown function (DUF3102)